MLKWCKIVEALDNQVLFFLEPDSEKGEGYECLHQVIRSNGVCSDIKIGGIPLEVCDKVFSSLDEKAAEMVVKTVEDLLESHKDEVS
jgi:hypothetical protein